MSETLLSLPLRWADFDPNFHLRHSVYYDFGATARLEYLKKYGLDYDRMQAEHFGPVLFREEAVFRREVRPGDRIFINLVVTKMRRDFSRFSFRHEITRENGTWESITQRLTRTINRGDCYTFTLDLAHGVTYSGYNQTLKLRIWGSTNKCTKNQLLFESPLIDHPEWRPYRVEFTAKQPVRYILIEAFYQEGSFRRKGNILIDNLSPLRWCPRA